MTNEEIANKIADQYFLSTNSHQTKLKFEIVEALDAKDAALSEAKKEIERLKSLPGYFERDEEWLKKSEFDEDGLLKRICRLKISENELQVKLSEARGEIDRLHQERCYICRPEDKQASEEGCADCDYRSDLHHKIEDLQSQLAEAKEEVERLKHHVHYDNTLARDDAYAQRDKAEKELLVSKDLLRKAGEACKAVVEAWDGAHTRSACPPTCRVCLCEEVLTLLEESGIK